MSSLYTRWGKRGVDMVVSGVALVLLAPLLLAVSVLVWAALGFPVFFRQLRPGLRGRLFRVVKFRTMRPASAGGSDAERLVAVGRLLRQTSLDELPELWNVFRGQMSLVGPRPLLPEYLPLYSPTQARRHDVRPGITGWAQVNGRNALSWQEKFELDVWYVDHVSLGLDVRILWRTVASVIRREGIAAADHATAPRFEGNPRT